MLSVSIESAGFQEKSALPLVESSYETLTQTERVIADYFLKEPEPDNLCLKAVSSRLAVSQAALVRFAQKCGFRGYREFVFQYEKGYASSRPCQSVAAASLEVLNAYQQLLNKTYSLLQEEQIERIARRMIDSRRIFVIGLGSSGCAAREMAFRFMRIGADIEAFDDVDSLRMMAVFRRPEDLVIGLSLSGMRREFLESLQTSCERGASTLLITSSLHEHRQHFVEETVLVPSLLHQSSGHLISPQFPLLIMIDILYAAYMKYGRKEKETLHEKTVQSIQSCQIL